MPRRTKEEAAATRESVLMAALDLFTEKGYSRTTFADIAKRIGMTRGAIYWNFDNKEALLAALIDHVHALKDEEIESQVPDVQTVDDLRNVFVLYARAVERDPVYRKFEFFLSYQMEWSEELLAETEKNLSDLRQSPLEHFRDLFDPPGIAGRFRKGTDIDQLVLTLGSFWIGACKLYLGRKFPGVEFGQCSESEVEMLADMNFEKTIADGFDLIMSAVLKGENNE